MNQSTLIYLNYLDYKRRCMLAGLRFYASFAEYRADWLNFFGG
jgi:hypothetical protein